MLAKPFTKEGMWKSVKVHASHLLKNPPQPENHGYFLGGGAYLNTQGIGGGGNSIKFDTPTPPSGTGGSTWSPAGLQQPSPIINTVDQGFGMMNGGAQYGIAGNRYSGIQGGDSSRISDHDSPPEKRQRLNAGQGNY